MSKKKRTPNDGWCRKCWSERYAQFRCHTCGKMIDAYNHIEHQYLKWNKWHVIGRCCSD